jgi:hypothetical protein
MSNLLLAGKEAHERAPKIGENSVQTQWAALQAAHQMASEKPISFVLVPLRGIGPLLPGCPPEAGPPLAEKPVLQSRILMVSLYNKVRTYFENNF